MPNLAQMVSLVHSKTYYSRTDAEVLAALEAGGFRVYSAILKEFRGMFLKVDETSLTLAVGVTEYTLPADVSQLMHLAERQSASENWHRINPETMTEALTNVQQSLVYWDYGFNFGEDSQFQFYGPYLDSTATKTGTQAGQVLKIRISPAPSESRFVQLAYGAKWLPIVDVSSTIMLPLEGTYAMQNYAVAEAARSNDDSLAEKYEVMADKDLAVFLNWLRVNQIMQRPQIRPYLG